MKAGTIIKSLLSAVGAVIPQAIAGKVMAHLVIWGVERLVAYTNTSIDDEALQVVKGVIKPEDVKKKPIKEFTLVREYKKEATLGTLFDGDKEIIRTLERPNLDNQKDNPKTKENESSCIPEGIYLCKKYSSPKFPDNWEVTNVPNRSHILIHCANYVYEIEGCIATATTIIDMNPKNDKKIDESRKWMGSQSRDAFNAFKKIAPEEFKLIIKS